MISFPRCYKFLGLLIALPTIVMGQYWMERDDEESAVKSTVLKTNYRFYHEDSSLQVLETFSSQFLAMSPSARHRLIVFYDDQSSIVDYRHYSLVGVRNKPTKMCGHVPSGDFFFSDIRPCLFDLAFNAKGDQATFTYEKRYKDYRYFTRAFFHEDFDIEKRTITFQFEEGLNVDLIEMNFDGFAIEKTVSDDGLSVTYTMEKLKEILGSGDHTYLRTVPHILPVVRSYTGPDEKQQELMINTGSLYQWYRRLVGPQRELTHELKNLADSLCIGLTTELDKIKALYYWVQTNIRYLAFEDGIAGFRPEAAEVVYHNRYGDCKGMANLLKSLLVSHGFDARLTWLGTDILPYTYDIPSLAVDNHMICTVFLGNDTIYLDATEKFQPLGVNALRIQGKEALIEDGENYILAVIPESTREENVLSNHVQLSITDSFITGRGEFTLSGEYKKALKEILDLTEEKDKDKMLNLVLPDGELERFQIDSLRTFDRENDFKISYSFKDTYNINSFGEETYLSFPHMKLLFILDKLKESDWLLHKIGLRSELNTTIDIVLPAEMSVSHLPENFQIVDDHYFFSRQTHLNNSILSLNYRHKILNSYLPNNLKSRWNADLESLLKLEKETIILTKIK